METKTKRISSFKLQMLKFRHQKLYFFYHIFKSPENQKHDLKLRGSGDLTVPEDQAIYLGISDRSLHLGQQPRASQVGTSTDLWMNYSITLFKGKYSPQLILALQTLRYPLYLSSIYLQSPGSERYLQRLGHSILLAASDLVG